MTLSASQFAVDHEALLADWPDTVTFAGRQYPCNRVSMKRSELLQLRNDLGTDYRLSLTACKRSFAPLSPAQGDTVRYGDPQESYRVLEAEECTDGVDIRLHLGTLYQGGGQ